VAQQLSQHLHWTQGAARREAETWATSQCNGKIRWQVLGDDMAMGHIGDRVFVVRSILLPLEEPHGGDDSGTAQRAGLGQAQG